MKKHVPKDKAKLVARIAELEQENDDLQRENDELQDQLDRVFDIVAAPEEDEPSDDDE